ncbi:AraC family transcriptional regulator [Paenibacillus hodogayensis]|uniref:AraC family transcriptional regulator n=1 Tax=Paenibacillus hodogayensis TaxID=279208 RepID=A0ABV5W6U5_9BACL
MKRSLSLKQKIWLTYFLIYTIPFLILGGMVYYNAVVSLQHEIERTNMRQLELVRDEIDKLMQEMNTLTTHLSMDPELTPLMVGRNGYAQLESVRELARYQSYNPHLEDILLYYYGNEELYSTLGTMSKDTLANEYYRFSDRDISQWLEDSDIMLGSEFIQAVNLKLKGQYSNLIAYVSPIPQNSFLHYGKVVLLLNGESLTNQIGNLLGDLRGSIFVLDESKRVMAYKNSGLPITESMLADVWQENWSPGIRQIAWNSKSYSLAYVDSERTGWSFVTLMPTEQFLSRVISMKIVVYFVLATLICVGILGTLVISRRQYRPIDRLFQNALNILPRSAEQLAENELDFIGNTLRTTHRSNLELIERVDLQKEIVKEKFLLHLLQGKLSNEQLEKGISMHDLYLQGNCYFVLIVDLENGPIGLLSAEHKEEVSRILNHFVFDGGVAYGAKQDWETEMVLIVALENEYEDTKRMRHKVVMELQQRVVSRIDARLTVSVGQMYSEPKLINRSYIEASGAMEYRIREGSGGVIFFDDIQNGNHDDLWYPIEDQIRFIQSLKQGDAGIATETLRIIIESIAQRGQSLPILRLKYSDLINSVFKLMRELRIVDNTDKIRDIAEFTSLSELEVLLRHLVEDICNHVVRKRESNNTRLQNEVITLIQSRFQSIDFSLEQLAIHFRLSSSYLSRFIKEQTGMTFTDYVQQLRQEEAKRLLVETDFSVKEIVGLVGYIGVSKYIEKFRKQEGITPGEYRKLYSKN